MTENPLAELLTIVSNLSPGNAPPWSAGVAKIYKIGLRDVPDCAASVLTEAIVDTCTFRPTVHEIKSLWHRLSSASEAVTPETVIAQLYALRDRYGEYAVAHPELPGVWVAGEPLWTDPIKRRVVAAMGGWVNFCRDEAPSGVQRGQLYKIALSVIGGENDATIDRLRLEYQEQVRALPPPPADPLPDLLPAEGNAEDGGNLTPIGELTLRGLGR